MSAYPISFAPTPNGLQVAQAPENALAEYARTAALKQQTQQAAAMAPIQQQLGQQQVRAAQMQNDQTDAINQAYKGAFKPDATGKPVLDTDALAQSLAQGGHGAAIPTIVKNISDYQSSVTDLQEKKQKLQVAAQDAQGQLGYALQQANYDPQVAHTILQAHLNDPSITPQQKQQLQQEIQLITDNPAMIKQMADSMVAQSPAQQARAAGEAKARLDNATAAHQEFVNKLTANSKPGDLDSQIDAMLPPNGAQTGGQNKYTKALVNGALSRGDIAGAQKIMDEAFQSVNGVQKDIAVATNPQIQAGKVEVARNTAQAKAAVNNGSPISIPAGATGEAALVNLDPSTAAAVRLIGDGKADFSTFTQRTTPDYRKQLAAAVTAYNPNFDQNTYKVRGAEEKGYTSGQQGQQLNAISTARYHMDTFKHMADALGNNDMVLANKVGNAIGVQLGSDAPTNFNIAKQAFIGEVARAFDGAGVTMHDREQVENQINSASSPAQLKGAADTADKLLEGKQKALKNSYDEGMKGKPNFGAQAGGGMVTMKAPNGATKQVSADQVEHYKSLGATVVNQ